MPQDDVQDGVAGKLGGRVAEYLARAYASTKERTGGHTVRLGMALQDEFFRLTGAEIRGTVGPLFAQLADQPDGPQWAKDLFNFVGRGQGQWQTLLAGSAVGAALGSGILDLVNNELNPLITPIIASNPNGKLSPEQAAAVLVHGLNWGADLEFEAAQKGINRERFTALQELQTTVLSPDTIVELYRRGEVDQAFALRLMHRAGVDGDHAKRMLSLSRALIPMADLGQMWNRSIVSTDQLHALASLNGFTTTDADRYAELGGEPPSPDLLYRAFRIGLIDADRLRRGIVQGPIRNEWFDIIEHLQFHSMTPDSAAAAVTQGHMDPGRARAIASEYGLKPDDMDTLIETAGRPPGVEFAAEAFLRGFLTEADWEAMFLESAIKNRYIPVMRQMRTRLVPQETARSLLAKGVMTLARCTEILTQHGFAPDDVAALIAGSTAERSQATRDLSLSAVRDLYAEQEITADDARQMLLALGFDDNEAQWELDLADLARVRSYRNAVVTRIRSGVVKGLMTPDDASNALDALAVPPARRDTLLNLWAIEQSTVTRDLTPAQIVSAAKKSIMDVPTAQARLVGQGYAASDAVTLLAISGVDVSTLTGP